MAKNKEYKSKWRQLHEGLSEIRINPAVLKERAYHVQQIEQIDSTINQIKKEG
jgi:hypothetical protein